MHAERISDERQRLACKDKRRARTHSDDVDKGGLAGALQTEHGELHLLHREEAVKAQASR